MTDTPDSGDQLDQLEATVANYEALQARLQAVVERLEAGELTLADLLSSYEEGVRLVRACQRLLDQADLRVQELQQADDASG